MSDSHETVTRQNEILKAFSEHLKQKERRNWEKKSFYRPEDIKSWMKLGNPTNLSKLLRAAQLEISPYTSQEGEMNDSMIVFAMLLDTRLKCGHLIPVFKKFRDTELARLGSSDFDIIRKHLEERFKEHPTDAKACGNRNAQQLVDVFDQVRWHYCPLTIDIDMDKTFTSNAILPFCKKDPINAKGGTANVFGAMIQEDFVSPELAKALGGQWKEVEPFGKCYEVAIKSYKLEQYSTYSLERGAFKALRSETGVVKYLGEYTLNHTASAGPQNLAHSILLEYGEQDLDEYLAENFPPVLFHEILALWNSVFDVCKTLERLHKLHHEGELYDGWHGDIKPDNILRVRGKFKLADFGFTQFKRAEGHENQAHLPGLTRTWGAPEVDNTSHQSQYSQKIDTWSLGCVLSSIATWVILGQQEYDRYPEVRMAAIRELRKRREQGERVSVPVANDAFHDGREVLPAVRQRHDLLRNSVRKCDTISERVLDIIENDMLVGDVQRRMTIPDLCRKLEKAMKDANAAHDLALSQDASKETALRPLNASMLQTMLSLDEDAPATATPARHAKSVRFNSAETGARTSGNVRVRKSERLDKNVRAKVAFREEGIQQELGQDSGKRKDHLDVPTSNPWTLPSAQFFPVDTSLDRGKRVAIPTIDIVAPDEVHNSRHELSSISHFNVESPGASNSATSPLTSGNMPSWNSTQPSPSQRQASPQQRILFGSSVDYPQPLNQYSHATSSVTQQIQPAHASHQTPPFPTSQPPNREPEIFRLYKSLKQKYAALSFLKKAPKDSELAKFIVDRDIKFVVDNSTTMQSHWFTVTKVLLALAMKIGPLDEDGLDLVYTIGQNGQLSGVKKKSILYQFESSMNEVGKAITVSNITNMKETLQPIFDDYLKDTSKRMTLIVLTDGLWQGSRATDDVENLIAKFLETVKEKDKRLESRWFSMQFISFGNDQVALKRLQDLDDAMEKRFNVDDVIDTKPWFHEPPDELILGSMIERADEEEAGHSTSPATRIGFGLPSPPQPPRGYASTDQTTRFHRPQLTTANTGSSQSLKRRLSEHLRKRGN